MKQLAPIVRAVCPWSMNGVFLPPSACKATSAPRSNSSFTTSARHSSHACMRGVHPVLSRSLTSPPAPSAPSTAATPAASRPTAWLLPTASITEGRSCAWRTQRFNMISTQQRRLILVMLTPPECRKFPTHGGAAGRSARRTTSWHGSGSASTRNFLAGNGVDLLNESPG